MRLLCLNLWMVLLASAATLDQVAVVVGKDVLTEGEVEEEVRLEEFTASMPLDLSPAQRRAAADHLVDQQLIRHEMEISRYPLPPVSEADGMVRTFQRQNYPNDTQFQTVLQRYGLTTDRLKEYFLWQLATLRFTDERFGTKAPQEQAASADRTVNATESKEPENNPSPTPAAEQSADRAAGASPAATGPAVDEQLDAWLKEVRGSTRIVYKKEAFQ